MNAVANDGPDAIAAHFASGVGDDPDLIIEQDPEPSVRQYLVDNTFDGEKFFLRHAC